MAVFRGKMVAAIRQTLRVVRWTLPEPMRPQQLLNLLNRLGHPRKTQWNVRIMERYRHWAWCGDVSGAVPAGWSHQERPPGGV
jgi:hypothetical protein